MGEREPGHSPSMFNLRAMVRDINAMLREYMRKTWIALRSEILGDPWNLLAMEATFSKDLAVLVSLREQLERVPYVALILRDYDGIRTPQMYISETDDELDDTCNRTEMMVALERLGKYLAAVSV